MFGGKFFYVLGVRNSYVCGLVFLRLEIRNSYIGVFFFLP